MSNKNVKGEYGFINLDGKYGSSANMVETGDPNFWEYIEDGIKPLVEIFVKYSIETFGSCQGHYVPEKDVLQANLRFYVNNELCNILKNSLIKYNSKFIKYVNETDINNRRTDRIIFLASPKDREFLNNIIINFSKYLDYYLHKIYYLNPLTVDQENNCNN